MTGSVGPPDSEMRLRIALSAQQQPGNLYLSAPPQDFLSAEKVLRAVTGCEVPVAAAGSVHRSRFRKTRFGAQVPSQRGHRRARHGESDHRPSERFGTAGSCAAGDDCVKRAPDGLSGGLNALLFAAGFP